MKIALDHFNSNEGMHKMALSGANLNWRLWSADRPPRAGLTGTDRPTLKERREWTISRPLTPNDVLHHIHSGWQHQIWAVMRRLASNTNCADTPNRPRLVLCVTGALCRCPKWGGTCPTDHGLRFAKRSCGIHGAHHMHHTHHAAVSYTHLTLPTIYSV